MEPDKKPQVAQSPKLGGNHKKQDSEIGTFMKQFEETQKKVQMLEKQRSKTYMPFANDINLGEINSPMKLSATAISKFAASTGFHELSKKLIPKDDEITNLRLMID